MNRKHSIIFAGLAVFAATGCTPQKPAAAAASAAQAAATPQTSAPEVATDAAKQATDFNVRAFAGTFSGTLPCASCPGIDTRIEFAGDGSYKLDETYQAEKDGQYKSSGAWTAEENGKRIRLDPSSGSDDDRLFEVLSNDEIRMLDTEGKHIESELPYNLKRSTAS
ncbi:MAG TPA: copper resistance protein NlpE [Pseudoxanthomonas sp.]|nr:copper resistance protein NlpE [Pseudoxanthomonas sp.]